MTKKTLATAAVTLLALVGMSVSAMAETAVKIGNVLPLSGPSASVGMQGKNAREMAVEEINAAGGIKALGGAKLELLFADSKSDPNVGVTETERLINTDGAQIITGCWNSGVTYPATAVAERYGIPFVVPVSVRDTITERGFKNVFRIAAKDSWWTRDQFAFLKDMQAEFGTELKTVAFVYENGDWGTGFAAQWKKLAEAAGFEVVLDEPYPSTATDLTPVVNKIRRAKPDVLLLTSNAADAVLITNTLADYKVSPKVVLGSGGGHADPTFLSGTKDNAKFMFDIVEWETDVNKPGAAEINAKYKAKYGSNLTGEAVDAYVATYVIADALERAASTDPAKIRDALASTDLSTGPAAIVAYDSIKFDTSGQNENAALAIVQINDLGKGLERITVWPKASRRAGYTPVFPMPKK